MPTYRRRCGASGARSGGRTGAALLLRSEPELDAIVCGSDQVARAVIDAVRDTGRRVPDDLAVVGFDNWEVMATGARPPLTTVDPEEPLRARRPRLHGPARS